VDQKRELRKDEFRRDGIKKPVTIQAVILIEG
jgi:hypothetical protein